MPPVLFARPFRMLRRALALVFALVCLAGEVRADEFIDAVEAFQAGDDTRAFQLFTPLAEAGNPLAQHNLGVMYEQGLGVAKNEATAYEWYKRASDQGNPQSTYNIGMMTIEGRGVPQDPAKVTKAPKLKKEHGLIDWTQSADQIARHIRAMQPWPTAYTYWHRPTGSPVRLQIFQAQLLPVTTRHKPGTVAHVSPDMLGIAAGDGTVLSLLRIQAAGKKELPVVDFLRGQPLEVGQKFGAEQVVG